MNLTLDYHTARVAEVIARLRRVLILRALQATGKTQREIAQAVNISQPAVSQQLAATSLEQVDPSTLIEAGGPVLRRVAEERGFLDLAVFGSVARNEASPNSDIDLLVRPPKGTTITGLLAMKRIFESILGRAVDLITYGGLKPGIDDDILREAVPL